MDDLIYMTIEDGKYVFLLPGGRDVVCERKGSDLWHATAIDHDDMSFASADGRSLWRAARMAYRLAWGRHAGWDIPF